MKKQKLLNKPDRVSVIGVPISIVNIDIAVKFVEDNLDNIRGEYICASNAHTCVMAHEDKDYLKVQSESIMSIPDGKPLADVGNKKGHKEMNKTTGNCFMQGIFNSNKLNKCNHYFYGSTNETLDLMIPKIKETYPNINICGYEPSVFRELTDKEVDELAKRINKSKADFVWFGIGAPKQENLMSRLKGKTNSVMTGIGGVFNILAGKISDAPKWMQKIGLEWFYRLIKDPKRLFKRYLITNSKYIWYNWRDKNERKMF